MDEWKRTQEALDKIGDARKRAWLRYVKEQDGRAQYTAWLVVPCNPGDYGLRPLASGTPYWASPFIWVESPDPSGQPQAGAENHLVARVFNLGAASAAPCRVDFFWSDPSVGLGAADANWIGAEMVEVPPMSSVEVRCATPWVPSFVNNGHECAFVSVDNHVLDPLLLPFQPWADRHVGQRNLSVLPAVQQMFSFWAPAGRGAELHVTALRGVLRNLPREPGNAVRFLGEAAAQLLAGLRPQAVTARREKEAPRHPNVVGKQVPAREMIAGLRATGKERRMASAADTGVRPMPRDGQAPLGETLAKVEGEEGTAVLMELQLQQLDLPMNTFVVLNITHADGDSVTGGYVLVLANPGWFRASPQLNEKQFNEKEDSMKIPALDPQDGALQALVLEQFPQAQLTLDIARALQKHLPISNKDEMMRAVKYITIENAFLDPGMIERFNLEALLPLRGNKDLVAKIAGTLRVALQQDQNSNTSSLAAAQLAQHLRAAPNSRGMAMPAFHFTGPSLYGSTEAKGE
ncbi:hypothetical protein HSX11_06210 [Oxalobacteraceae bacterium]|nr:hypothetical protein [Oxalobacteraceae bacterium]